MCSSYAPFHGHRVPKIRTYLTIFSLIHEAKWNLTHAMAHLNATRSKKHQKDIKALPSNQSKLRNPGGVMLQCAFKHSISNALEFQLKVTTGKYSVLFSPMSFRKQEQKRAFSPCLNHKISFWLPKSSLKTSSKTWENWRGSWKVTGTVLLW